MALNATIFKADLAIADMERSYYAEHALTLARHPSETDARMMVRLLAFALHASNDLAFGRGLCVDDEPDLWRKDLTGAIDLWIEVGLPDEKWLRKASARARRVVVYSYGGRAAELWWQQNAERLARVANLTVLNLPGAASDALARLAKRSMTLQCSIHDGQVWLTDGETSVEVEPVSLQAGLAA